MGFGKRAAKNGKILRKNINQPAVDGAIAGNHAIAGIFFLFHPKIDRAVRNQHPDLLERAFIHQKMQTLAGGKLSFFMLSFNAGFAAA